MKTTKNNHSPHIVCFPGSFDPITLGHLEIIKRLAHQFQKVIVLVSTNPEKTYLFTHSERAKLTEIVCRDLPNVEVHLHSGLTVEFLEKHNISLIARGIRNTIDLQYEQTLFNFNRILAPKIDTIYLISENKFLFISSKNIKELIKNNVQMEVFLPKEIIEKVTKKVKGLDQK